jgi:pyruvate dehydrogenase E1 component
MPSPDRTDLKTIEQRLLWLSHWMVHRANHFRPKVDGIKIGGHQASSASMVSIPTARYFSAPRPEDRVATKPHASPARRSDSVLAALIKTSAAIAFRPWLGSSSPWNTTFWSGIGVETEREISTEARQDRRTVEGNRAF